MVRSNLFHAQILSNCLRWLQCPVALYCDRLAGFDGLSFGGRLESAEIFRVLRPLGRRRVCWPPAVRVQDGVLRTEGETLVAADAGWLTFFDKLLVLIFRPLVKRNYWSMEWLEEKGKI